MAEPVTRSFSAGEFASLLGGLPQDGSAAQALTVHHAAIRAWLERTLLKWEESEGLFGRLEPALAWHGYGKTEEDPTHMVFEKQAGGVSISLRIHRRGYHPVAWWLETKRGNRVSLPSMTSLAEFWKATDGLKALDEALKRLE